MKRGKVLIALQNGEFDGISHKYEPYSGYGRNTHQKEIYVSNGSIEVTTITVGKSFNGKENERFEESNTKYLNGSKAIDLIESHPYYFSQIRPDLF